MLNRSASLAMSTRVLKALPGKLDIERHSPSILYLLSQGQAIGLKICFYFQHKNELHNMFLLLYVESTVLRKHEFIVSSQFNQISKIQY